MYAERYHIVRQIERQNILTNILDQVDHNVQDVAQKTKSELGFSGVLKMTLNYSQDDCKSLPRRTADQDVDRELNQSACRRAIASTQLMECPTCQQKILICCFVEHNLVCRRSCVKESNDRGQVQKSKVTGSIHVPDRVTIAMRPHPIKNLRLIAVSFDAIHLAWDPPIFDGGEPLIDFQLSYYIRNKQDKAKRTSMSCLRWCQRKPHAVNSFILYGLHASSYYLDIRIRCRNCIGWSDYSVAIDSVKTGGMFV